MKKYFHIIISVLFSITLTSCSIVNNDYPTDDTYHFETDSQYTFYTQGGFRNFAESEDGYYFTMCINGSLFIFYADKQNMQPVLLCNKPNCLHYNEMDSEKRELCTAFLEALDAPPTIFYSNDCLYAILCPKSSTIRELVKISKDGSSRQSLFNFKDAGDFYTDNIVMHRGAIYISNSSYDENMKTHINVWKYDVNTPDKSPQNLYNSISDVPVTVMDLKVYGNHLYFSVWDGTRNYFHLNLQNNKLERIFNIDTKTNDIIYDQIYNIAIMDNHLITELIHMDDTVNAKTVDNLKSELYTANLNGNNIQKWQDVPNAPYSADDTYFYKWSMWSGGQFLNKEPFLRIYDKDWNLLVDYDPSEYIDTIWDVYVSPGEFVFFFTSDIIYYFSKSEISTGKITPKLFIDMSNVKQFMG